MDERDIKSEPRKSSLEHSEMKFIEVFVSFSRTFEARFQLSRLTDIVWGGGDSTGIFFRSFLLEAIVSSSGMDRDVHFFKE